MRHPTSSFRFGVVVLSLLALAAVGCEAVGAPDDYKAKICPATAELAGPLADTVAALAQAVEAGDTTAIGSALDQAQASVDRIAANLVDVPGWVPGHPIVTDLTALVAAYRSAIAQLRQAVADGAKAKVDAALAQLQGAPQAAADLGQHMQAARVVGLNC